MTKCLAIIVAVLFVLSSNIFTVAASAADYSKIDISDYVSGREFVGNDVIVTYDLPLRPYTDLFGFATGSNTPLLIDSFDGNLFFTQNDIDENGIVFEEVVFVGEDEFQLTPDHFSEANVYLGLTFDEVRDQLQYFSCDYEEPIPLEWTVTNSGYLSSRHSVDYGSLFEIRFFYSSSGDLRIEMDDLEYLSYDTSIGFYKEVMVSSSEYQRINGQIFPLGKTNTRTNIVSVGDIKSGSGFTLSFDLRYYIEHDAPDELNGNIAYYDAVWLDKDFNEISRSQEEIDWAPYPQYYEYQFDIDFTVPQGAAYFYLDFTTGYFYVNTAYEFSWVITDITMTTMLSSIEENSQTMQKVQQKLDKLDEQLGDIKDELTPTPEQNDKAEQLEQEIGNASDKLENNNSTLEDLTPTRPEINTDLTLDEEKLFAVSPLITNIWSLSGMQGHIGIVVLVATVAYIFFGKRDS